MAGSFSRLKGLDAFPKIQDDFYSKTMSGGIITLISAVVMAFLFATEFGAYLSAHKSHQLSVDTSRGETITVSLDVTLPGLPCDWFSVDAMDVSGNVQLALDHDVFRQRLDRAGRPKDTAEKHDVGPTEDPLPHHLHPDAPKLPDDYCGSCYGSEETAGACCNTCEQVRESYRKRGWNVPNTDALEQCKREGFSDTMLKSKGEGCRVYGKMEVAKVAGNIHIAPGKSYQHGPQHVHDLQPYKGIIFDVSHTITSLSFGQEYPGQLNPLTGARFDQNSSPANPDRQTGMYQYFLKVVPSSYKNLRQVSTHSNQYSVTEHFRPFDRNPFGSPTGLPGIFFFYDLSPIKVSIEETRQSFLHFITNVCAIVGGVFTVSGIVDSILYHGDKLIRKKQEIGKYT